MAEAFRSGLEAIEPIQTESAYSLGMNRYQTMRYIILPQAMSISVPAFVANVIFLLKETSVFSAISLMDLMFTAKDLIGLYYKTTESLFLLVVFLSDPIYCRFPFWAACWKGGCVMPDLGLEVLLKGSNMLRLLQGLWVALRISLIAVVISIPLGIIVWRADDKKKCSAQGNFAECIWNLSALCRSWYYFSCFTLVRRELLAGICRERQRPSSCLSCGAPQR